MPEENLPAHCSSERCTISHFALRVIQKRPTSKKRRLMSFGGGYGCLNPLMIHDHFHEITDRLPPLTVTSIANGLIGNNNSR